MRKYFALASIILVFILASCNWNVISSDLDDSSSNGSSNADSIVLFNGDAPKNVFASQARFNGEVVVSFDGVAGADSYTIERVALDKTSTEEPKEEDWRIIATVSADSDNSGYRYSDTSANNGDKVYLYRVKAGSMYADFIGTVEAKYSEVAKGWPLSPPTSLNATQGVYTNKIILEWSQIDLVRGYNVYYQVKGSTQYTLANTDALVPAVPGVDIATYEFQPSANDSGVDISFYVESVSRGNKISDASGIRTGYTFQEGAPDAPTGLEASDYYSCSYIEVKWDKPKSEGTEDQGGYYKWQIYRSTPTTDQILIKEFNSNSIPSDIIVTDGVYHYEDTYSSNNQIETGVSYTYTVRAVYVKPDSETGTNIEMLGKASSDEGCLIVPAVEITDLETDFESGIFSFTINPPAAEFMPTCKTFSYGIKGRNNQFGESIGAWRDVTDQCKVVSEGGAASRSIESSSKPIKIEYQYDPEEDIQYKPKLERAAQDKAFVFLMTGDRKIGREAVDFMLEYLSQVQFNNLLDITREIGRALMAGSLVYDYCYDLMTPEERRIMSSNLVRIADDMEIGWPPFRQGYASPKAMWQAAFSSNSVL